MKEQISPLVKKLINMPYEPELTDIIRQSRDADEEARLEKLFNHAVSTRTANASFQQARLFALCCKCLLACTG